MAHPIDGMPLSGDPGDVFSAGVVTSNDVAAADVDDEQLNTSNSAKMRATLQALLDSKERQLQQAGTLGQRVLAQQMELEERVRQLQDMVTNRGEHDDPTAEMRLRYRELAKTVQSWNEENAKLSSSFNDSHRENGVQPVPSLPLAEPLQEVSLNLPSGPSVSQSRRAKNAAHRANDVEFAFEIGSSLLTEVRRLQSLLGERDKAIQNMKEEKDDLEKAVETLRSALREQEQNADKFKEENWNLEVSLQEMRAQLADVQAVAQRGEAETKRLTKALASARESNDSSKNEVERLQRKIEEAKSKHETDVALHRKQAAALARDKSDLQQTVDTYKAELARATRRLPRFNSPNTPGEHGELQTPRLADDEDDPFGPGTNGMGMSTNRRRMDASGLFPADAFGPDYVDASPDPSPSRPFLSPNHPSNEIEALQQKLAHAQRQINTLKGTLAREKELRIEYRRKMLEAGLQGQRLEDDDDDDDDDDEKDTESDAKKPKPRTTPFGIRGRRRGRGRGVIVPRSGGRTLAQKLLAAQSHVVDDSDEEILDEESDASAPSTAMQESVVDERAVDTSMPLSSPVTAVFPASPSPEPSSNRASVASVEGMDPEFANVLRRAPSVTSASRRGSPFTGGTRGGRVLGGRRRGGTAFQQPRPSSLVGAPEALAAELGLANTSVGMESVREDEGGLEREMKEIACQTEVEERAPLPPVVAESKAAVTDVSIQTEALETPPLPTLRSAVDAAVQVDLQLETEAGLNTVATETKPTLSQVPPPMANAEASTQTDEPVRSDVSVSTDSETRSDSAGRVTNVASPIKTSSVLVQTDLAGEPHTNVYVGTDNQTPEKPQRSEAETQTTPRVENFPHGLGFPTSPLARRRLRYLSSASNATAVPISALQVVQDDEDEEDSHTELAYTSAHEPETETDGEDYRDALSAAPTPTVSDSLNEDDFHSMSTMTDNEFSEDEDDEDTESIKASVLNVIGHQVAATSSSSGLQSVPAPVVTYESTAVETDPPIEESKRMLSEMSIQTDEWRPAPSPAPIPSPVPQAPAGFGLYRVGPSSQQFQFVSPAASMHTTTASAPVTPLSTIPPVQSLRDAPHVVSSRPMRFSSPSLPAENDKSVSLDSAPEVAQRQHTQSLSTGPTSVDKSRPPTMMLPPPPKLPPPPNSMPPPSFIPEKRRPTSVLSSYREMPPPRPSSPPPPELIHRATTPTFGSVLTVPGRNRQHGSSLPPMSMLRQPTSVNSSRSVANSAVHAQSSSGSNNIPFIDRRLQSAASLLSDQEDVLSRRSSISSDFHHRAFSEDHAGTTILNAPGATNRSAANVPTSSTDPTIIHAITQTMIGEFLYKYTRRAIGRGHGERRHRRFFWVHPYTKTLYWSSGDPGSTNVTEQSAKSAYIDSVRSILDPNPMPPGLYQYSIVVSTPQREMKFTAPTKERHEIWLNALNFLLARPAQSAQSPTATQVHGPPVTPVRNANNGVVSPMSMRTGRTEASGISNDSPWSVTNVTPRGARRSRSRVSVAGSVGKRSGTPAAEYLRWADGPGSPGTNSMHGFELNTGTDLDDDQLDFEINDSMTSDREGYEGLENVRACCDGRHTVGRDPVSFDHLHDHGLAHKHTHIHRPIPQFARHDPAPEHQHASRPSSPAFSFRSRTSSRKSGEGMGNLFSRFGTRRSKTPAVAQEG